MFFVKLSCLFSRELEFLSASTNKSQIISPLWDQFSADPTAETTATAADATVDETQDMTTMDETTVDETGDTTEVRILRSKLFLLDKHLPGREVHRLLCSAVPESVVISPLKNKPRLFAWYWSSAVNN